MKEKVSNLSRTASFIIMAFIYIFVSAAGIIIYRILPFDHWLNLLIADVAATVLTFVFSVVLGNASVYDPYWSVQPVVILASFAVCVEMTLPRILVLAAVSFWGIRLTANWAYTFHGLKYQDWRYTMLCEKTGKAYPFINFTGIHMVPTLIVYACVMPAVEVMLNDVRLNVFAVIFLLISVSAAVMQGIADIQMHIFRKNKTSGFIRNGLWKYSRHPNYLGEILMWWGIGLYAVSMMPQKWYLLAGALFNTCLFLIVSIPMADGKQAKKAGFEEYRRQTWMLLPIPKYIKNK